MPDGPVIMFAHGFGCDQNMWRFVAPSFEDRYRVICFDHVGSGGARAPYDVERYATLDGYADDVVQMDRAMRWGFNWELGPFESWDAIGFAEGAARMKKDGIALPKWVDEMLAAGVTSFYRNDGNEFYDPFTKSWKTTQRSARAYKLPPRTDTKKVVEHNDSATLFDIGDGVFLVEFHSKMNSVDPFNTEMLYKGVEKAEKDGVGLVIGNEATDAGGAGLAGIAGFVRHHAQD